MHNDTVQQLKYYAQIIYKTRKLCVPLKYWQKSGRLKTDRFVPEIYVNYLLRTDGKLPNEPPLYLRVTSSRWCVNEGELSDPIMVKYGKNDKLVPFGVCLHKALFSITNPQLLVDWIEIHKQLGAEIITVYLEDVPEIITKAVQPYIKEGLLELIDWNMKKRTRDFGQSGVMNDCLYRNLYRVKYLGMYDLDEVIVPQKHYSWHEMIEFLKSYHNLDKYASLRFNGCSFHLSTRDKVIGNNVSLCQNMSLPIYFRWTMREKVAADHPKLMITPARTISVQVHRVEHQTTQRLHKHFSVPTEFGLCHHYAKFRKPLSIFYSNIMTRYERPVLEGIKKRMCHDL